MSTPCPCSAWKARDGLAANGHHPACPLGPGLAPDGDGSCRCGATVCSTDLTPCYWCGGYTLAQLRAIRPKK